MSDFSDRPFVAGTLNGIRSFQVDSLGRLTGVTVPRIFKPGVNTATCSKRATYRDYLPRDIYGTARSATPERIAAARKQAEVDNKNHHVASVRCACGYYAYFDGSNDYSRSETVTALIAGSGVCTIGTRGFRAEKAELLAFVGPRWKDQEVGLFLRRWVWTLNVLAVLILTLFAVGRAVEGDWWLAGMDGGIAGMNAGLAFFNFRRRPKRSKDDRFELLARNYPDVPVFSSLKAALREHPVSPPPMPTPDEDDFWTRSAP